MTMIIKTTGDFILAEEIDTGEVLPPGYSTASPKPSVRDHPHAAFSPTPACADIRMLIPLYSYPNWFQPETYIWDDIAAAGNQVQITAIINPNNGPESCPPNSDYLQGIADLRAGGIEILGYIYTSYSSRVLSEVKADVDLYDQCFNIDGIFFDEVSSAESDLDYYTQLYSYVQVKPNLATVFLNPGTHIDESYLSTPAGDTAVIFESQSSDWLSYVPDAYVENYPPTRTAMLAYDTPDGDTACSHINLTRQRGIGYVYLTDDSLSNPWDSLPGFWDSQVDCIERLNTCGLWLPIIQK